jgi:hypothetical protein
LAPLLAVACGSPLTLAVPPLVNAARPSSAGRAVSIQATWLETSRVAPPPAGPQYWQAKQWVPPRCHKGAPSPRAISGRALALRLLHKPPDPPTENAFLWMHRLRWGPPAPERTTRWLLYVTVVPPVPLHLRTLVAGGKQWSIRPRSKTKLAEAPFSGL